MVGWAYDRPRLTLQGCWIPPYRTPTVPLTAPNSLAES
jgi:hypothetical protein